jgi:methylated-DNA-[protein]-cysteine S-methyltransferase
MHFRSSYASPLGELLLVGDSETLTGLLIEGKKRRDYALPEKIAAPEDSPALAAAAKWLGKYFAGEKPDPSELPLSPEGSAFRQEVWKILLSIPYGETMTYGAIAKMMAKKTGKEKMSAQAVGGAVGRNPIGIIIPCHRVMGANGNLTGYGGGIPAKVWLLEHEGLDPSSFSEPKKNCAA